MTLGNELDFPLPHIAHQQRRVGLMPMAILNGAKDSGSRACGPLCVQRDFAQQKEGRRAFWPQDTSCKSKKSLEPITVVNGEGSGCAHMCVHASTYV